MNSPEESAVRDLGQFTMGVLNGLLDMHSTAASFINYSFPMRTVKAVVRRGSENAELINQIADSLNHLVIYLNEEIVEYAKKASPVGMESRYFTELLKRIHLLYEVWLAMEVHKDYQDYELTKHVDASREAVKLAYEISKNYDRWKELNPKLREFFLDEKEDVKSAVEDVEPTLFARDDGVVTSLAHEQAQSDEDGKKKQFVMKTEKVLNNYRAKNPDYKTMRELINATANFRLDGIHSENLINEIIAVWDMAIEHQMENSEEKHTFTALLKKVFLLFTEKQRNDLAAKLYDKYKEESDDVLPNLENFIENFSAGLTGALNSLPLDSTTLSNNTIAFDKVKDRLIWYLFVSPVNTLHQLLLICIDNKGYVPLIIRICRSLPTLFDRSVHITPNAYEDVKKERVLITLLHRIFVIGRTTWTNAAQWENAAFMTMSFGKCRKRKDGQPETAEDKALIDSHSLIEFALTELPRNQRKPQKAVEMFTRMLQRLLANNNNARMLATYRFGNSFQETGDAVLPTPIIIQLMYELLIEYEGTSAEISDAVREILKSIGGRMEADGVVFDSDTCAYLTEESFNGAPWWIKYSINSWFSFSLQKPKRQVPSGVYQTLSEANKDLFEQIKAEETASVSECYLRSLFELGLFDVELAIDLLHYGHHAKFGGSDAVEKIALAFVDSYGKRLAKRNGGVEIGKLVKAMLKTFDPIRELVPLKAYSNYYFDSVSKIEHIIVLFMAARIAREKELSAKRVGTSEEVQITYDERLTAIQVAEHLMDIFCETAKAHVEGEASEVAKLREHANSVIFTPGVTEEKWKLMTERDEREQSLVMQVTMLYLNCSHFCRLYQNPPIKLQQLMNVTLDKQFDSQKLVAKMVMDEALTDQRKGEVVYAIVDPPAEPKNPEKEVVQPVKQSELMPSKQPQQSSRHEIESTSAENLMFGQNGEHRHERRGIQYGNRNWTVRPKQYTENERLSQRGPRSERERTGYRPKWTPVNDTQTFNPRDRDAVYSRTKNAPSGDYDHSSRDKRLFDHEKLYFDDRRSPFDPDVRRHSESRSYNTWNSPSSRRFPSESEFSHEDSENRLLDKTVRFVHGYSQRDTISSSRAGSSSSPPPKAKEVKQKKEYGGDFGGRRHGPTRKPADRNSFSMDQEEEGKKRVKAVHSEERRPRSGARSWRFPLLLNPSSVLHSLIAHFDSLFIFLIRFY
ncbi:unnamed protein product [Caenorhabditis sp. 36 PRJEB53466]|nr:unnamed protein product [Caenorhabditis sp. 36 PRJEB53466]